MVRTLGDVLYSEMRIRGLQHAFQKDASVQENFARLNQNLIDINVSKCTLVELDQQERGSALHLIYLLQSREGIPFGLCPFFKMWRNTDGWQYGCQFDKGRKERLQVYCEGSQRRCSRPDQLASYNSSQ